MRAFRFGFLVIALAIPVLASGCNAPLRYEKTEEISPGETRTYTISAPKKEQKVKIEVSSDEPIAVEVRLEEKLEDKESLAKEIGKKQIEIEVTIPAGKSFVVLISTVKKCTVTTKVNSL